jgi:hypothetical protein
MRESAEALGGLRLRVESVWQSPRAARFVEDTLRAIPGVRDVAADPSTGSVAIIYEPTRAPEVEPRYELLAATEVEPGYESPLADVAPRVEAVSTAASPRVARTATWILETIVTVAIEVTLQRALGTLFWPRRH